jgi:hypothetical protein
MVIQWKSTGHPVEFWCILIFANKSGALFFSMILVVFSPSALEVIGVFGVQNSTNIYHSLGV